MDQSQDAFARIVDHLGDPEWRRDRRLVLLAAAAVMVAALAVLVVLVPSRSREVIAFSLAFLAGIVIDLAILRRRYRRIR